MAFTENIAAGLRNIFMMVDIIKPLPDKRSFQKRQGKAPEWLVSR